MSLKEKLNNEATLKTISIISYFMLCLTIVAKDYFNVSSSINTFPLMVGIDINTLNPTLLKVLVFAIHSLLYGLWVEILARFVCNSVMRVSFENVSRYKFLTAFKGGFIIANLVLAVFNFMYFYLPFTFRLMPVIEILGIAITFAIIYAIIYKKYLNKKSAPVIFMSMALPLAVYFIIMAV